MLGLPISLGSRIPRMPSKKRTSLLCVMTSGLGPIPWRTAMASSWKFKGVVGTLEGLTKSPIPTRGSSPSLPMRLTCLRFTEAGWLREPGLAYSKNAAFSPGGSIFKRITSGDEPFGENDLYAAYRLREESNQFKFGRLRELASRGQTRFLFYFVVLDFLRDTLIRVRKPSSASELTKALLTLPARRKSGCAPRTA